MPEPRHQRTRRSSVRGGFALIEITIAVAIMAIGLLSYISSALSHQRLSKDQEARSEALQTVRRFMERLRADDDWDGLYARLRTLQDLAATAPKGMPQLADGRRCFALQTYYKEIDLTHAQDELLVLVDVPYTTVVSLDGSTSRVLREDVNKPHYGLPFDLDGDGKITAEPKTSYVALPVLVTFRWTPAGESTREMRRATWLYRTDR